MDGEPPEDVLPRAKVPPCVWKVGYPAGKFVVKPGKLAMVTAKLLQEQQTSAKLVGCEGDGGLCVHTTRDLPNWCNGRGVQRSSAECRVFLATIRGARV